MGNLQDWARTVDHTVRGTATTMQPEMATAAPDLARRIDKALSRVGPDLPFGLYDTTKLFSCAVPADQPRLSMVQYGRLVYVRCMVIGELFAFGMGRYMGQPHVLAACMVPADKVPNKVTRKLQKLSERNHRAAYVSAEAGYEASAHMMRMAIYVNYGAPVTCGSCPSFEPCHDCYNHGYQFMPVEHLGNGLLKVPKPVPRMELSYMVRTFEDLQNPPPPVQEEAQVPYTPSSLVGTTVSNTIGTFESYTNAVSNAAPVEKETTTMSLNANTILALQAQKGVTTVQVTFADHGSTYTYKTNIKDLKKGDKVLVNASGELKVATVAKVDSMANVTLGMQIKWILGNVTDIVAMQEVYEESERELATNIEHARAIKQAKEMAEEAGVDIDSLVHVPTAATVGVTALAAPEAEEVVDNE